MTDGQISRTGVVDSLSANEFTVEVEGETVSGVFKVANFVPFKLDVTADAPKLTTESFKIAKMVQRDPNAAFNRWTRETIAAKFNDFRPKRSLAIVAMDDGVETRRWLVKGAWISEIAFTDFDTGSGELVQETLTIHYESIDEVWSMGT